MNEKENAYQYSTPPNQKKKKKSQMKSRMVLTEFSIFKETHSFECIEW